MKSLDVGCGSHPLGDVNTDVCKILEIRNFILSDAHALPFKNNTFKTVYAIHVLEHCKNPYIVLSEMKRVANGKVVVKIPNVGRQDSSDVSHLYAWSESSLFALLSEHFCEVNIYLTKRSFSTYHPRLKRLTLLRSILLTVFNILSRINLMGSNELTAVCYT